MKETQRELLKYIEGSGGDGVDVSQVSEDFDIEESTAYKRFATLRKHDWAKRIRNEDNELVHILTDKGKKALESIEQNPKNKSKKVEVSKMAVSIKIEDDIVEELDQLCDEEGLESRTEAVDFALSDYFGLIDEETETQEELEENR